MNKLTLGRIFVITAVVGVLAVALAATFTWVAYRGVLRGAAPGALLHPRRIETPFTLEKGIKPSEFAAILRLSIYPGSIAEESAMSRWVPMPRPKSGKGVGLALLRLKSQAEPEQVESWYKKQLGSDFVETQGNLAGAEHEHEWLQRILREASDTKAVLFVRSQPTSADGVLLEPDQTSKRVVITIFRYGGARPE